MPKKVPSRLENIILELNMMFFDVFLYAELPLTKGNLKQCWKMFWEQLVKAGMVRKNLAAIILGKSSDLKQRKQPNKEEINSINTQIHSSIGVLLDHKDGIESETREVPEEIIKLAQVLKLWVIRELNLILVLLASIYVQQTNRPLVGVRIYNLTNFDPENLLIKYGL